MKLNQLFENVSDIRSFMGKRAKARKKAREAFMKKDHTPEELKAFRTKLRSQAQADRRILEKSKRKKK